MAHNLNSNKYRDTDQTWTILFNLNGN